MRFVYGYKTRENEEREGEIRAPSRDAVYRQLKAKGIRPFKVVLAPGFFNKIQSFGKRWLAIALLGVVCVVLGAVVYVGTGEPVGRVQAVGPMARHQIYGDPALMDELSGSGYAELFDDAGLRLLAHYAQPGVAVPKGVREAVGVAASLVSCVDAVIDFKDDEPREERELKQIVLSMQSELRRYLSEGDGTPERYKRRLDERQEQEAQIYRMAVQDLEGETDLGKWQKANEALRAVGLKTIPKPIRKK